MKLEKRRKSFFSRHWKACSTLDLSESEFDELYRFFADNNIAIDEYKESGLSDESEILENSMLDNCSESDEEDDLMKI